MSMPFFRRDRLLWYMNYQLCDLNVGQLRILYFLRSITSFKAIASKSAEKFVDREIFDSGKRILR